VQEKKQTNIRWPFNELSTAIYVAFGDGTDHMQSLVENYGEGFDFSRITDQQTRTAMREPLIKHMSSLQPVQQQDLRASLQYLLNSDESMPYSDPHPRDPTWREKKGSLSQKIRDSTQDAATPYDGYAMCQWMWEALFGEEDWHTDISNWVVVKY
jgi:hypothetical protein